MKKAIFSLSTALILTACATPMIVPSATGGSKADGIIELSYEYNEYQKPVVDEQAALQIAQQRCNAWGYKKVNKFGGQKRQCVQRGTFTTCGITQVTVQYQCID